MSQWKTRDVTAWMREGQLLQHTMYCRLGDREWDEWKKSDKNILLDKIGFGLFCLPKDSPEYDNLENSLPEWNPEYDYPEKSLPERNSEYDNPTGYSQEQVNIIKNVADVILMNSKSDHTINFGTIFVFGKIKKERFKVPVFKVKGKKNQTLFVDSDGCVYESWKKYLESNNLPKCMYCFPRDGLYQEYEGEVLVDFGTSPACLQRKKAPSDTPATAVSFASTFDMIILSFIEFLNFHEEVPREIKTPVTGVRRIILAVVLFRRIRYLVKKYLRGKSYYNTRNMWNFIFTSVANFVRKRITEIITQNAEAGEVVYFPLRTINEFDFFGSFTVNYLATMSCLYSLADKADKRSLNSREISKLTSTTLFYLNINLNKYIAENVIAEAQQKVLNAHSNNLSEQQLDVYFRLMELVPGKASLQKNANKIKAIKDIHDKNDFYNSLIKAESDLEGHQVQYSLEEPGLININNELIIAPNKLVEINGKERKMILDATKEVRNNTLDDDRWNLIEKKLQAKRLKMEFQRRKDLDALKEAFKVEDLQTVQIGSVQIFEKVKSYELDTLANTVNAIDKKYSHKILKIANEFANRWQCEIMKDYINYLQFTIKYLYSLKKQDLKKYKKSLDDAIKNGKVQPNRKNEFALSQGITGNQSKHFMDKVINSFHTDSENSYNKLMQYYSCMESEVQPLNEKARTKFTSTSSATYHYFKHRDFGRRTLTAEQYFTIAEQLVEEPLNQVENQLNQRGNLKYIIFTNTVNGALGVVYETLTDSERSLATLFYDKKVLKEEFDLDG